jgi:hypothetical protein
MKNLKLVYSVSVLGWVLLGHFAPVTTAWLLLGLAAVQVLGFWWALRRVPDIRMDGGLGGILSFMALLGVAAWSALRAAPSWGGAIMLALFVVQEAVAKWLLSRLH